MAYRGMSSVIEAPIGHRFRRRKTQSPPFAGFFEREYPRLVRLLVPTTHDIEAAEELAQEAMTRVFERWDRVSDLQSPIGYTYVVAVNLNRRRFRRPWLPLTRALPDPKPDPEWQIAARDEIAGAVAKLSQGERDTVLLVSVLGLSTEEASEVLKIKPASVRSRLHRARASLSEIKEGSNE